MTAEPTDNAKPRRPRGRPRVEINSDEVADAVADLFAEGGLEAVSIMDAAEKLSVSRATLYRTVPTKEHLLGILLERSTAEITDAAHTMLAETEDPAERLLGLVRIQVDAAITMRRYLPAFFGGGGLPEDVYERWLKWTRQYERMWVEAIELNMETGHLPAADPVITARLLLGACLWISRWYRPEDRYTRETINDTVLTLVQTLQSGGPAAKKAPTKKTATTKAAKKTATTKAAARKTSAPRKR